MGRMGEAGTGEAALEACARLQPDLLVLDIGLPGGMDGLEVARRLKDQGSPTRILVLTGSEERSTLFEARRIGVDAFVEKQGTIADLPEAIRAVADGEWTFSAQLERNSNQHLAALVRWARETSRVVSSLTP